MKKRLLVVLSIVFILNSMFSTCAAAANVKRGAALNAVISATKNDNFSAATKGNAYKAFKDNKSFNKKLKNNLNIALANKIVKKSKKFYAQKAVTRMEFAKWIYVSMTKTGYDFKQKPFKTNPKKFKDVKKAADKKIVRYVHKYGVMDGVSKTKFAPKKKVSNKVFKKIIKNLKKAIKNRLDLPLDDEPINPDETPGVDATPTIESSKEPAIPTATTVPDDKLTQFVSNALMETTTGYETVGNDIHHVKGYVGNGIKVLAGEKVTTTLKSTDEILGKEIDFSLDIKKISSATGSVSLKVKANGAAYDETIITVDETDIDDVGEWKWVNQKVTMPSDDSITGFEVSIVATGADFVIDNFNALHAVKENYVSRAYYESSNFKIRAQVDHATGTISAFVPAQGTYTLKTDVIGNETAALSLYESKVTKVNSGNEQLTLTSNYEASSDNAGKVDYKATIDGKGYVLFANNGDASGMRNYLAYHKAQNFGPNGEWPGQSKLLTSDVYALIDLFADGQYLGVYTMVEDITKKSIDNLEFMVEFNATEGNYTVGGKKYRIVNNGSMSEADVQTYIEDVNEAFLAFKKVGATSSELTAFGNAFDELIDVYSCVDWILFNEYFVTNNADFNKNFYVYKVAGEKLRFAVWDDYSISCGNDSSITIGEDNLYIIYKNDWADGLSDRQNIYPLIGSRAFFCKWNVIKERNEENETIEFADQLATLKTQVENAYSYDKQLWGTSLDGMDDYIKWIQDRALLVETICDGYGKEIW